MNTVILAEKPSVARDIAGVVGAGRKRDGYLESTDGKRIVTWAFGHLVRYADPDDYGAAWSGKWGFGQLPMIPDTWDLRVDKDAGKQFGIVKRLINAAERVICATDAGREGEHIFRLIYEHAGCRAPVQRLWVSSLTREALSAGFQNLFPAHAFDPLAQAAQARAKADWLVGMNLTRAYTVQNDTLCSVGRVQTPTLAMVVERDRQIETFTKSLYHEVVAHLEPGFDATYARAGEPDDKGRTPPDQVRGRLWVSRIDSRQDAEAIVKSAWNRAAVVEAVEVRRVHHRPPSLYDLTTLQREANERLGWTAAQTLAAAQALYEAKLVTYPRTESRHLPEDARPLLADLLTALPHPHAGLALDHLQQGRGKVPGKGYIDNAKLTDHHAIIPTKEPLPESLAVNLGALYALVVARFVSIFFPDRVVEETTARLDISGHVFLAGGWREIAPGWRVVGTSGDDGDEAASATLPPLSRGQHVVVQSLDVREKETAPPKPYTDATLLAAMKNAGRRLDDAAQVEVLKESGGLGTPATRASMIEGLVRRGYLTRRKKALVSTDKGRGLVAAVAETLRSPELTATWERQLKEIEEGEGSAAGFLDAITGFVRELVPQVQQSSVQVPTGGAGSSKAIGTCPLCGKGVVERTKAFGCSAWRETGCGFAVWKTMYGKKITAAQVKALLSKGRTPVIKGFKNKSGTPFEAALRLDGEGKMALDFGGK